MRVEDVAAPTTMAETVSILRRKPDAVLWAGGTLLVTSKAEIKTDEAVSIIDLGRLDELTTVNRTDRYIELGSCVLLSTILALPQSLTLEPLRSAAALVGTAFVRNLATIGGNIAARGAFMTCFPALACMDAAIELKDANGSHWAGINNFITHDMRPSFPKASVISRIRIPTESWDATAIRHLETEGGETTIPASFAASARFEKETISELRLIAAGEYFVRDRDLELSLIGRRIPLVSRDVEAAAEKAHSNARETGFSDQIASLYASYLYGFLAELPDESI